MNTPTPTDPRDREIRQLRAYLDEIGMAALGAQPESPTGPGVLKVVQSLKADHSKLAAEIAELKERWNNLDIAHAEKCAELESARKERDEAKSIVHEALTFFHDSAGHSMVAGDTIPEMFQALTSEMDDAKDERDTALAAKDAEEKRVAELTELIRDTEYFTRVDIKRGPAFPLWVSMRAKIDEFLDALTPAPTQEPPAGGVTTDDGLFDNIPEFYRSDVPSEGRGEWMPFNLSDALSGKPVVTRDGRTATELHIKEGMWPLRGVVNGVPMRWTKEGRYYGTKDDYRDLFHQ